MRSPWRCLDFRFGNVFGAELDTVVGSTRVGEICIWTIHISWSELHLRMFYPREVAFFTFQSAWLYKRFRDRDVSVKDDFSPRGNQIFPARHPV